MPGRGRGRTPVSVRPPVLLCCTSTNRTTHPDYSSTGSYWPAGSPGQTVIRHGRDELRHKVIVDTPDIDSVLRENRELTGLVFAADVVLFVTSPEKYKVMQSADWVHQQRQQRALAFVLNKVGIHKEFGLQFDRRSSVRTDFRRVLAESGSPVASALQSVGRVRPVARIDRPGPRT